MFVKALYLKKAQALAAVLVVALAVITTTAHGQTWGWSSPVLLSQDPSAWFPDVAADITGQVHVVWSAGATGYDTVMYTSSQDGKEWSEPTDIAAAPQVAGSEATRPAALVDPQGTFHLTWRSTDIYYTQSLVQSSQSAVSWLAPRPMNDTSQVAYFSRLARDRQGILHLVFTENVYTLDCRTCYHVFYRQSDDNGLNWSAAIDISDLPTGAAKPQVLVDQQDNIHVVWEAGQGGAYGRVLDPVNAMYTSSHDKGKTWSTPVKFESPSGNARNVTIGLDGEGQLLAVWLGVPEDLIYYQLSRDQGFSWSPPQVIPGVWGGNQIFGTGLDDYTMATDGAGNVHLVLVGRLGENQMSLSVLHAVWNGTNWLDLEAITTLTGNVPEWPRIAIGRGNQLHVVWFVRDEAHAWDPDHGKYQIWYARGLSSAPEATPVIWPTHTPISAPRGTATLVPTVTPLPRLAPGQTQGPAPSVSIESLQSETAQLVLLAKVLASVVLLIIVAVLGVRVVRR